MKAFSGKCPCLKLAMFFLSILFPWKPLYADFDLPISEIVPKIVSVSDGVQTPLLSRFLEVRDLTLEVRLIRGNILPDELLEFLKKNFSNVPKRIVLGGDLNTVHIERLRQLDKLEVQYEIGSMGIKPATIDVLYSLGPVRKLVRLNQDFDHALFRSVGNLKQFMLVFRLGKQSLTTEQIDWLSEDKHHRKVFILPADFEPEKVYELTALSPLTLQVRTMNNRIEEKLLQVLKDLKGVELTVVVDGWVTMEHARKFAQLERFSLKVELGQPTDMIPGLVQLLNRISPP